METAVETSEVKTEADDVEGETKTEADEVENGLKLAVEIDKVETNTNANKAETKSEAREPESNPASDLHSIPFSPRTLSWHFYGDEGGRMLMGMGGC